MPHVSVLGYSLDQLRSQSGLQTQAPLLVSALKTAHMGVEVTCLTEGGVTGSLGANRLRRGGTTTGKMRPAQVTRPQTDIIYSQVTSAGAHPHKFSLIQALNRTHGGDDTAPSYDGLPVHEIAH